MNKTAFIFPGQGAQKCGMGKDFYENSELAKEIFDTATAELGLDMTKLCFEENEQLDQTEYTQAAMVTDRKSTRLNSSHNVASRMPSSA